MIELISETRCVKCFMCVKVCPMNVFEAVAGQLPVIARKEECQTCFICEAYCPADALYVAPQAEAETEVEEDQLIRSGLLGSWREEIGWSARSKGSMAQNDTTPFIEIYQSAGKL